MEKTKGEKKTLETEADEKNANEQLDNPETKNNSSEIANKNKTPRPPKITYITQKVTLPVNFGERIEYINNLFENEEIGFIINYAPVAENSTIHEMGKYFKLKLKTIFEIASGILFYFFKTFIIEKNDNNNSSTISENNKKSEKEKTRSPDEILKSKKFKNVDEVCELYKNICAYAGVKIEIISGFMKKQGYKIGDSLIRHKWCLLLCPSEKQFLIDPYLAIKRTSIEEKGNSNDAPDPEKIKPYYFLTPPEFFIENHMPDEEKYQILQKTLKVREFTKKSQTGTENFYNMVYKYKIKLQTHFYPEFFCKDSEVVVKFMVDNMDLFAECTSNGKKLPEDKVKITDNNFRNRYETTVIFQNNGEYKLVILGKPTGTVIDKFPLLTYKINVKITNIIKHEENKKKIFNKRFITHLRSGSPQYQQKKIESSLEKQLTKCSSDFNEKIKNKCFDNEGAHLYEPRTKILKIGQEARFRVRVKNAKNVAVLDGRKWNYLKKKETDVFEGIFTIENESVVLCAMRNKNIFTEVFEFLAIKR